MTDFASFVFTQTNNCGYGETYSWSSATLPEERLTIDDSALTLSLDYSEDKNLIQKHDVQLRGVINVPDDYT